MDSHGRNALRFALLIVLSPVLAVLPLGHAASAANAAAHPREDALALPEGDVPRAVVTGDVVPGVVFIKLRRPNVLSGLPATKGSRLPSTAMARCGVTSLSAAFPMVAPLSDADARAGKADLSRIHYGTVPPDRDPRSVAAQLSQLPEVEYAEPKYYHHLCTVPNDPDFAAFQQVYLDRLRVADGWSLQKGNEGVVIAVVDGGTYWEHPDLRANIWFNPAEDLNHNGVFDRFPAPGGDLDHKDNDGNGFVDDVLGWNFGRGTNDPRGFLPGDATHGTETASLFGAVAGNGIGMAGTSWNCRIMALCVSDPDLDNQATYGYEGIVYAYTTGARVINCSWTRPGGAFNFSQAEQEIINAATEAGALIVAGAGNAHEDMDIRPSYPALYQHVLSVGATMDTSDQLASFTNYGLNVSTFAPGTHIRVCQNNGLYGWDSGTSHASPMVAGLAGLLFAAHPDWTPDQVAMQIRMTSDPIDKSNPVYVGGAGHGRANFYRALSEVHSGVAVRAGELRTPQGRTFSQEGDTLILSATVQNVLTMTAEGLAFGVWAEPVLTPLGPARGPARLAPGAEGTVQCAFRVGSIAHEKEVKVMLGWTTGANEQDAHMFKTMVYAGGGSWEQQVSPVRIPLFSVHAVNSAVVWATGVFPFSADLAVLRTTDGGNSWLCVNGDLGGVPMSIFAVDSLHAWVGGWAGQISSTTDGGATWKIQEYPPPQSSFINGFWFSDAANGYAMGDPGAPGRFVLLKTTNGGRSWAHFANEPVGEPGIYGCGNSFCSTDREHLWFGASNGTVWRSTDGGYSWSSSKVGAGRVSALAVRDNSMGIACTEAGREQEPACLARTTDGGATWETLPGIKADGGFAVAFPAGAANAWVAGEHSVLCSRDHGMTWVRQPADASSADLMALSFCDPANGWMVTRAGDILRYREHSGTVAVQKEPGPPEPIQTHLQQNYPNPFNSSTTILYALSQRSTVRLTLYNVLGQRVATLVEGEQEAGYHEVRLDGSTLASGVYLYSLQAGNSFTGRKLLLVR